jgi:CRP-like cAMP-binding protein
MSQFLRKHIEAITPLTDEEFEIIQSNFTVKRLKKHQFLLQEGDPVKNDHLVVKGLLKAYHLVEGGKEHILQFAMEDWWITDYQAYLNEGRATLFIECLEDCELLCLSLRNREKICADQHAMEHFFRKKVNAGYVALQKRILSMLRSNGRDRYEQLLKDYPTLLQRIPKTLIAAYLGISRETLSRFTPS